MEVDKYEKFKELYSTYHNSEDYSERAAQFAISAVNREIIWETLKNDPMLNEYLTGFIQMFKYGCTDEIFDKYIAQNIKDPNLLKEISDKAYEVNKWGYTSAGLNAVTKLTPTQLTKIKSFLSNAFRVKTIEEATSLCRRFDDENIPLVKSGIYSPWLYYINPQIFPILNNSHTKFRDWMGIPADYPSCIKDFNKLKELVNETELGVIDYFAYNFENYMKQITDEKVLNLNGYAIYKISHGLFKNGLDFKNTPLLKTLQENNWVCLHSETGKSQGKEFAHNLKIGDYVYVCYGGDDLYCIAQILSVSKNLPKEINDKCGGDGKWIYREIKPLYFPETTSVRELKSDTRFFMPSGNSTFYEVPKDQLDYLNQSIFIPKFRLKIIDNSLNDPITTISSKKSSSNILLMNSILYGPPGTGKTFHSISHAVATVENRPIDAVLAEERSLVKKRFDQYINIGQIVFCTFHQSLSYEDFIEGIKPLEPTSEQDELTYAIEDGIFKRLCTEASFSFMENSKSIETEKVLDFSTEYDRFVDYVNERFSRGEATQLETRSRGNVHIDSISQNNNILVKHIDGNRMYTVSKKRLAKLSHAFPDLNAVSNINDQFRSEIGGSNSSAYWAVLNAIRNQPSSLNPKLKKEYSEKEYSYEDKKEIIKSLNYNDFKVDNPKMFVLIIDEINRGNVSQIFGELITLIEIDKRLGKEEAIRVTLPYSKESFGVPYNLAIIGTMNTADRSVEALDTALRRRFSFVQMVPQPNQLEVTADGIKLSTILEILNKRLSILKDSEHTIGHAWLWNVDNIASLKNVFGNKILPLLKEYFYNDYEKLGLVLGDAFFKRHEQINNDIFAQFSGGNNLANQYEQSWMYELKSVDELTIQDFKSLEKYHNQTGMDVEQ